jgi:uncharacterized membrane protein
MEILRDGINVFITYMCMGFILDLYTRIFSVKDFKLTKKESLKLLLNMPVYGTGGLLFYFANKCFPITAPCWLIPLRMLIGGLIFTLTELGFGMLFNVVLKLKLWDYSYSKFNFKGQIDLVHGLLWTALSLVVIFLNYIF